LLLAHPGCGKLTIFVRKLIELEHSKLNQVVCDYRSFNSDMMPVCDRVFCCLGTTINVAGSKEAFEAVDWHYPVAVAKAAKEHGARVFSIITALGSTSRSTIYYSKVKGLCEDDLVALGFDSLIILRPSMLLGHRTAKRPAEKIGQIVMHMFSWVIPARYQAVNASCVASVMVHVGMGNKTGLQVIESDAIRC
jgi:uncharacterized protein YbjT (DUF2867 family)